MPEFTTFKRWQLKKGCQESELLDLVREQIIPHYQKLSNQVTLALLNIEGTQSYLALQYWESREIWEATMQSDAFKNWFEAYQPILAQWDELVTFEDSWESVNLLSKQSSP
ncbi:MAG: hypothetical protein AAF512_22645 [Pseudomonadota bacterium]